MQFEFNLFPGPVERLVAHSQSLIDYCNYLTHLSYSARVKGDNATFVLLHEIIKAYHDQIKDLHIIQNDLITVCESFESSLN